MSIYQRRPKIIIVGSGRSGTSTVARLCHERLGVCQGHALKPGDQLNPQGYYEDIVSHGIIRQAVEGIVTIQRYLEIMNDIHSKCPAWGVKDPWFLFLNPDWKRYLNPHLVIYAQRNVENTVQSWLKVFQAGGTGMAKGQTGREVTPEVVEGYRKLTMERQQLCEESKAIWTKHLVINFDTLQDEDSIVSRIKERI